jgi:cell wall-associated NlpC family hydrolase
MTGDELAAAAETLIGARFRLHGRDPATGLDCIGVLAAALARCDREYALPNGYPLRSLVQADPQEFAMKLGFIAQSGGVLPGDVHLLQPGPAQVHLAIAAPGGRFIHAHAGLGRVVGTPGPLPWPVIRRWRTLVTD